MSKTSPVRWWRDDETRFHGRGAYKAPEHPPDYSHGIAEWAAELLKGPGPELAWLQKLEADEQARRAEINKWFADQTHGALAAPSLEHHRELVRALKR